MKARMYLQAIALLEKEVNDHPTNAEAHFQLGSAYAVKGRLAEAEERFKSAVQLSHDYGRKIGDIFKKAGKLALENSQTGEAQRLFGKMLEYQPDLRASLSQELFAEGENSIRQGLYGAEDNRWSIAAALNYSLREKACAIYTKLGDDADDSKCLYLYSKAKNYCDGYNEKAGRRLLSIARGHRQGAGTRRGNQALQGSGVSVPGGKCRQVGVAESAIVFSIHYTPPSENRRNCFWFFPITP